MMRDRNVPTSVKFTNSFLDKIQEYVKNYHYKDTSHFIREACQLAMDVIDKRKYFKDNPKEASEYLNEQGLKLENKKMNEAILEIYKGLSEEEKEKLFLGLDLERKERAENKLQKAKHKRMVLLYGGELEPKVGYRETHSDRSTWFRPITPSRYDGDWDELTLENKQTLLAELRTKLLELESENSNVVATESWSSVKENYSYLKSNIEEISNRIKEEEILKVNKEESV